MRDVSRAPHPQSEAIASLREALAYHQPIVPQSDTLALRRKRRWHLPNWIWSPLLLLGLAVTGGIGMVALQWLLDPPPVPNCRALSPLAASAKRLHCAQQLATTGQSAHLAASINVLKDWGPNHALYPEAQALLTDWSRALLENAEDTLHSAGLEQAVRLARYVPVNSPVYETAQEKISDWQRQWADGERIYQTALTALEQKSWKQASQQVVALGELTSPYWSQSRANALSLRILAEQKGQQALTEAQSMAAQPYPDELATALVHLQTIPPQTLAQAEAEPLQQAWSSAVAESALAELAAGQLTRAVELAQSLPVAMAAQPDLPVATRDLIRYSHAQRLASQAMAQPERWWVLMEAIAAAEGIMPQSDLAQRIQPQLVQWRSQLEASQQLQVAQAMAGTGQRWLLQFSLAQAEAIGSAVDGADGADASATNTPLRSQTSALKKSWRQTLAQIDGRPRFDLAQRTAQPGTQQALRDAIAMAEALLPPGMAWPQVQQAITDWRSRLQMIEDRPIIGQAQQLAADGKLREAIAQIEAVAPGRSLYAEAQSLVQEWQGTLRAAADRDRLAEARDLAGQLRLSQAIEIAQAIAPASGAVYNEAQVAISQWQQERDDLWAQQRSAEEASLPVETSPSPEESEARLAPAPAEDAASPYDGYYGTTE